MSAATRAALLAAILLLPTAPASAATLTVAAGVVAPAADGQCSLREAIFNADSDTQTYADCAAGSGADVVTVPGGTYAVDDPIRETALGSDSAFVITSDVTIVGAGSVARSDGGATSLDAGGIRRHFDVEPGASLTLVDLRLQGGDADISGGAVLNRGDLHTTGVAFVGNDAGHHGGAVANCASAGCSAVFSADSTVFSANTAGLSGGAILNYGDAALQQSVLSGNQATIAGALANRNAAKLTATSVLGNVATDTDQLGDRAPLVNNHGSMTVDLSSVVGNSGPGLTNHAGSAVVQRSTFTGNGGAGVGGLYNHAFYECFLTECTPKDATMTVRNSTVSGNSATGANGVGGVYSHSEFLATDPEGPATGLLSLTNVTVSGNAGDGQQLRAADLSVRNTVVAAAPAGTNCLVPDPLRWSGRNNVSDDGSCATAGFTQVSNVDLGPLADNGGPTRTQLPHPASPLIDAGSQTACEGRLGSGTDQRGSGYPRTVGAACDIGAVEADPGALTGVLISEVEALRFAGPAGGSEGLRQSLLQKLAAAEAAVGRGGNAAAVGQLEGFSNEVSALRGDRIREPDAQLLISSASTIGSLLSGDSASPDP